jgi:hypothetical protein
MDEFAGDERSCRGNEAPRGLNTDFRERGPNQIEASKPSVSGAVARSEHALEAGTQRCRDCLLDVIETILAEPHFIIDEECRRTECIGQPQFTMTSRR